MTPDLSWNGTRRETKLIMMHIGKGIGFTVTGILSMIYEGTAPLDWKLFVSQRRCLLM